MEYTINRTNRIAIIVCAFFLILYELVTRLLFLLNPPAEIDIVERLIRNGIFLIPFGYLMLALFKYFRHYLLKIFQISVLIIFIVELISKSTLFTNMFESAWKRIFLLSASTIWVVANMVMVAGLFRNKNKVYPGMLSIRNYALCSLIIFGFVPAFSFFQNPVPLNTQLLVGLTSAIPYIFIVVFALKLKIEE